jgi:hypothetical protein
MHNYSDASVSFTLGASRRAMAFIVTAAGASVALLAFTPGSVALRAACIAWCVAIACHALRGQRQAHSVRVHAAAIVVDDVAGEVVNGSFVAPWLTVVRWRPAGARLARSLLVLPDMLDAGRFRRLRVILRWAPPEG